MKIALENSESLRGELSIEKEKRLALEGTVKEVGGTPSLSGSNSAVKKVCLLRAEVDVVGYSPMHTAMRCDKDGKIPTKIFYGFKLKSILPACLG